MRYYINNSDAGYPEYEMLSDALEASLELGGQVLSASSASSSAIAAMVLRLLEEGKITAEEAQDLARASGC